MTRERAIAITVLLLRLAAGLIFMQAGGMKILDWFGGIPAENGGHPRFLSQIWIGGMLELVGGLFMIAGLFTRVVAFILSGEMAVAYFQFHQPGGTWPIQNHGEAAALFCFIFLFFAAHGAGPCSLDALWRRRQQRGLASAD